MVNLIDEIKTLYPIEDHKNEFYLATNKDFSECDFFSVQLKKENIESFKEALNRLTEVTNGSETVSLSIPSEVDHSYRFIVNNQSVRFTISYDPDSWDNIYLLSIMIKHK